jgi:molybdopterin-guanine dinucleotide biosynthesis protein A
MSPAPANPIGVVLAGGQGRRIGGDKATTSLGGRPLLSYALQSLLQATREVAVVAKPSTMLPPLGAVPLWEEPEEPSHPLVGIVEALRRADGRPVLVCAGDMPFVPAALLAELAVAASGSAPAAVACTLGGALQPLLGRYDPEALAALSEAASEAVAPAREVVAALRPLRVPVEDPHALFNVNTPEDLQQAEKLLARRG